jgi:hypothetical protein
MPEIQSAVEVGLLEALLDSEAVKANDGAAPKS